jgi:C4-dicarboxylate-specific signal transduction histidine kinase
MAADSSSSAARTPESQAVSSQAAKITELTEANRRLKRRLFDLYTLFEISRNLSRLLEIERLLDNLLLTAIGQMGIGGAAVVIDRDAADEYLGRWRAKGVTVPKAFSPRLEKKGALLQRLRTLRMPVAWPDLVADPNHDPTELETLKQLEAALVCPMFVQEQVRGVLVVSRRLSGVSFSENDKEFLSILISHFAVAMDNARLYESERQAHLRLREAQAQLVHSEKLAAMGRLSATIAHEVNNPLGIIKNYLHLMRAQVSDDGELPTNLRVVTEEVDRIAEIVRRLLDFHRPAQPGQRNIDLWHVIDDCLKLIRKTKDHQNVRVSLPDSRSVAPVRANPEELKQVFLNLFMNALDAMPQGGTLTIRVTVRRKTVLAQVIDSGGGIAAQHMASLFDPFFTTKSEGQGTGLGLYVCYGIIRRHGGRITARNGYEGGAAFSVRLPLTEAPS